jgi:transposase, IS5 family
LQQWFSLSDPAVEGALYDSLAMRRFVGIDLGREPVPDETTVCRFRHLLETHDLGQHLFAAVQRHLADTGLRIATGTIVDATIIKCAFFDQVGQAQRLSAEPSAVPSPSIEYHWFPFFV